MKTTFLDTLRELEAKATEGRIHAGFSNEIVAQDTGQNYKVTHICQSKNGEVIAWFKDHRTANLHIFLRNHAKEIINLVEAAEYYSNEFRIADAAGELQHWPENEVKAAKAIYVALAAMEKEQS